MRERAYRVDAAGAGATRALCLSGACVRARRTDHRRAPTQPAGSQTNKRASRCRHSSSRKRATVNRSQTQRSAYAVVPRLPPANPRWATAPPSDRLSIGRAFPWRRDSRHPVPRDVIRELSVRADGSGHRWPAAGIAPFGGARTDRPEVRSGTACVPRDDLNVSPHPCLTGSEFSVPCLH
jgi:hypothetical protein